MEARWQTRRVSSGSRARGVCHEQHLGARKGGREGRWGTGRPRGHRQLSSCPLGPLLTGLRAAAGVRAAGAADVAAAAVWAALAPADAHQDEEQEGSQDHQADKHPLWKTRREACVRALLRVPRRGAGAGGTRRLATEPRPPNSAGAGTVRRADSPGAGALRTGRSPGSHRGPEGPAQAAGRSFRPPWGTGFPCWLWCQDKRGARAERLTPGAGDLVC